MIYYQDNIREVDLTVDITEDDDLTDALDLRDKVLVGLVMPDALTSTSINFQFSQDNIRYRNAFNSDGDQLTTTVAASSHVALSQSDFMSAKWVKLAMGSNEAADRTITALTRMV